MAAADWRPFRLNQRCASRFPYRGLPARRQPRRRANTQAGGRAAICRISTRRARFSTLSFVSPTRCWRKSCARSRRFHEFDRARAVLAALRVAHGERLLADPRAAGIVERALLHFDGQRYRLLAWCVMPTHVHALAEQIEGHPLSSIVHSGSRSARTRRTRRLDGAGRFGPRNTTTGSCATRRILKRRAPISRQIRLSRVFAQPRKSGDFHRHGTERGCNAVFQRNAGFQPAAISRRSIAEAGRRPAVLHQEILTYSKSPGWLLIPTRGGAIQLAYSPRS